MRAVALVLATLLFSAPVAAAESAVYMPDVTGMILSRAEKAIAEAVAPLEVDKPITIHVRDIHASREVTNLTNWKVCWQVPKPGREKENLVTARTWVGLGVARPATECWGEPKNRPPYPPLQYNLRWQKWIWHG